MLCQMGQDILLFRTSSLMHDPDRRLVEIGLTAKSK
jgi:hypothetical protein